MKRCSARFPRLCSALLVCAVASACAANRGADDELLRAQSQSADIAQRLERAEASTASLEAERIKLIDEMEDLRQANVEMDGELVRLRRSEAALSAELATRESELAHREQELSRLSGTYTGLVEDLESEVAAGQIQIEQLREGLRLNLSQEILFSSGSARINAQGAAVLKTVALRLETLPDTIEVRGHTDNVPIVAGAAFRSNWELAAARAATVVELFEENRIDPARMAVLSFGEHAPIASNDTPEGRAQNRRIEIRLQPVARAADGGVETPDEP
jgi:chemotaxis protein MotB